MNNSEIRKMVDDASRAAQTAASSNQSGNSSGGSGKKIRVRKSAISF